MGAVLGGSAEERGGGGGGGGGGEAERKRQQQLATSLAQLLGRRAVIVGDVLKGTPWTLEPGDIVLLMLCLFTTSPSGPGDGSGGADSEERSDSDGHDDVDGDDGDSGNGNDEGKDAGVHGEDDDDAEDGGDNGVPSTAVRALRRELRRLQRQAEACDSAISPVRYPAGAVASAILLVFLLQVDGNALFSLGCLNATAMRQVLDQQPDWVVSAGVAPQVIRIFAELRGRLADQFQVWKTSSARVLHDGEPEDDTEEVNDLHFFSMRPMTDITLLQRRARAANRDGRGDRKHGGGGVAHTSISFPEPRALFAYHEATSMDFHTHSRTTKDVRHWSLQPSVFRRWIAAPLVPLMQPMPMHLSPTYKEAATSRHTATRPGAVSLQDPRALSTFLSLAAGTSGKRRGSSYTKRCNASSGCLHPVETYVLGDISALLDVVQGLPELHQSIVNSDSVGNDPSAPALRVRVRFQREGKEEQEPPEHQEQQGIGEEDEVEPHAAFTLAHYATKEHALEVRAVCCTGDACEVPPFGKEEFVVVLTTLPWRQEWKYGERGGRYAELDVGHSIASVAHAAAAMGWSPTVFPLSQTALSHLLGLHTPEVRDSVAGGSEEVPALAIHIRCRGPSSAAMHSPVATVERSASAVCGALRSAFGDPVPSLQQQQQRQQQPVGTRAGSWTGAYYGVPNHTGGAVYVLWQASEAARTLSAVTKESLPLLMDATLHLHGQNTSGDGDGNGDGDNNADDNNRDDDLLPGHNTPFAELIRTRRSCHSYAGTATSRARLVFLLDALGRSAAWHRCQTALPAVVGVHVLNVDGVAPGLYAAVPLVQTDRPREEDAAAAARMLRWVLQLADDAELVRPRWWPASGQGHVFTLRTENVKRLTTDIACHQEMVADSCLALSWFARPASRTTFQDQGGACLYRVAHWQAGFAGQSMYHAAAVAGLRACSIGCFIDKPLLAAMRSDGITTNVEPPPPSDDPPTLCLMMQTIGVGAPEDGEDIVRMEFALDRPSFTHASSWLRLGGAPCLDTILAMVPLMDELPIQCRELWLEQQRMQDRGRPHHPRSSSKKKRSSNSKTAAKRQRTEREQNVWLFSNPTRTRGTPPRSSDAAAVFFRRPSSGLAPGLEHVAKSPEAAIYDVMRRHQDDYTHKNLRATMSDYLTMRLAPMQTAANVAEVTTVDRAATESGKEDEQQQQQQQEPTQAQAQARLEEAAGDLAPLVVYGHGMPPNLVEWHSAGGETLAQHRLTHTVHLRLCGSRILGGGEAAATPDAATNFVALPASQVLNPRAILLSDRQLHQEDSLANVPLNQQHSIGVVYEPMPFRGSGEAARNGDRRRSLTLATSRAMKAAGTRFAVQTDQTCDNPEAMRGESLPPHVFADTAGDDGVRIPFVQTMTRLLNDPHNEYDGEDAGRRRRSRRRRHRQHGVGHRRTASASEIERQIAVRLMLHPERSLPVLTCNDDSFVEFDPLPFVMGIVKRGYAVLTMRDSASVVRRCLRAFDQASREFFSLNASEKLRYTAHLAAQNPTLGYVQVPGVREFVRVRGEDTEAIVSGPLQSEFMHALRQAYERLFPLVWHCFVTLVMFIAKARAYQSPASSSNGVGMPWRERVQSAAQLAEVRPWCHASSNLSSIHYVQRDASEGTEEEKAGTEPITAINDAVRAESCSTHEDTGILTAVINGTTPGLEVWDRSLGAFVPLQEVQGIEVGDLVVFLGKKFPGFVGPSAAGASREQDSESAADEQRLTRNDLDSIAATPHRVVSAVNDERFSQVFLLDIV